jgi:3'-5' exoribonuclease
MNTYISQLEFRASILGQTAVNVTKTFLIDYPNFIKWSGSHAKSYHHYGEGGLLHHTFEVIDLAFVARERLGLQEAIDGLTLYFACLFHDTGKMFDYVKENGEWKPTAHRRLIHHISESALIWSRTIYKFPLLIQQYHDPVLHAILAHHGGRQFGSPIAPKTRIAWLLHLTDGISARMNDCDRVDVLDKP